MNKFLELREGVPLDEIMGMQREYSRFLSIAAIHGTMANPLNISQQIDPFWHVHLLFSQDYMEICKTVVGQFLHHHPTITQADRDRLAGPYLSETIALYTAYFGTPDEKFWPPNAQICGGASCACSGTGNEITLQ